MRIVALLAGICGAAVSVMAQSVDLGAGPRDFNEVILRQIETMPRGGGFSANHSATERLTTSVQADGGKLEVEPGMATPGYCSGATYLVFLKTIEELRQQGVLRTDPAMAQALTIHGQRDGEGVWGRWNANGPGTARLFAELRLGTNFTDFQRARPGDFMKVFWTSEVGAAEHGHSVIYLGTTERDGTEYIRFWSSNMPNGNGEKEMPRAKIAQAIFSRLEKPENLARATELPRIDPYLSSLLRKRSSLSEARAQCGIP